MALTGAGPKLAEGPERAPLKLVLPATHPLAAPERPVSVAMLQSDIWTASAEGTGHHAMVVGTCRPSAGTSPTCGTAPATPTSNPNPSALRQPSR